MRPVEEVPQSSPVIKTLVAGAYASLWLELEFSGVNTFRAHLAIEALMLSDVDFLHLLQVSKHLGALTTVHAENGLAIIEVGDCTFATLKRMV